MVLNLWENLFLRAIILRLACGSWEGTRYWLRWARAMQMIDVESLKWAGLYLLFLFMYFFMIFICFRFGGKAFLDSLNPKSEFFAQPFRKQQARIQFYESDTESSSLFCSWGPTIDGGPVSLELWSASRHCLVYWILTRTLTPLPFALKLQLVLE